MNYLNFINYNEKEERYINESDKGDYWKFLDASIDEIDEEGIYLSELCHVNTHIKNKNLKEKMKNKLINLIMKKNLASMSYHIILKSNLFSDDEIKMMIDNGNYIEKVKDNIEDDHYIYYYLRLYFYSNDNNWITNNIIKMIDTAKNRNDFDSILVYALELARNNKDDNNKQTYNKLLDNYKRFLPDYYKNYIEIENDNCYIHKKALEFEGKNIKIGINKKISIGVEIEMNLKGEFNIDLRKQKDISKFYMNGGDPSLDNGDEIQSVPFYDNKKDVARLCAVCESLKEIGAYYNEESHDIAGQINFGLNYLDTTRSILYFYELFCNSEELLFYISNEEGQLIREPIYKNGGFNPISKIIGKRIIDEDLTREKAIDLFRMEIENTNYYKGLEYKQNTIAIRGNNNNNLRLEIRIPNGTVNYKTWIDNIRLYGKMIEVSKKLADFMNKDYLTTEEMRLLKLKIRLEYDDLSLDEKLGVLMNLLFEDYKTKQIYIDRYNSVIKKIQENNSDLYKISNKKQAPMFGEVEFKEKYESKIDTPGIIYNYETDEFDEKKKSL